MLGVVNAKQLLNQKLKGNRTVLDTNLQPALPQTGDCTVWKHRRLEVVDLDGKRVDKVPARRVPDDVMSQ